MNSEKYYNSLNIISYSYLRKLLYSTALIGVAAIYTPNAIAADSAASAAESATSADNASMEEVVVTGRPVMYANNSTDNIMLEQKAPAASVLSVVNNLPGVFISEGGTFGSDDWSTTISIRGFNVGLGEQQIGMTIDGLPNGNSNYGGGSKANRYIDSENLSRAEVSQGTSDISSPSNEALGGTINFITNDPNHDSGMRAEISAGDHSAHKYFFRYDTGEIAQDTYAYLSYSRTSNKAWIGNAGGTGRDHISAKIVREMAEWTLTGRFSWDNVDENNYQRIGLAQFKKNPNWDRLTDVITGIPYVDQAYRPSWGTLRSNYFVYLRAAYQGDNFTAKITPYFHSQNGRGDWTPPYLVKVSGGTTTRPAGVRTQDSGPQTIFGGSAAGKYTYVDTAGNPLTPNAGCTARLTFPYGGGGAANNPACYAVGATPVGSYRHTHYHKKRTGITVEATINVSDNNSIHTGLWWEHANRDESRDWHKVIDSRSSNQFDNAAYWRQYDRNFITNTLMLYAEDTMTIDKLVLRGGLRKFIVDLTRTDNFGIQAQFKKNSNSKILFDAGAIYNATDNLSVFTGFSQNFAAIKDTVLEGSAETASSTTSASILATLANTKAETANNFDVGLRYSNDWLHANLTGYYIKFNNRIVGFSNLVTNGQPNYLGAGNLIYRNVGGVKSKGIEASLSADVTEHWNIYSSLTINNSTYTKTFGKIIQGNKVALSPEFQLVGTLSYNRDGMRAGVSAKHVGKRWGNLKNTDRLPAFTTVDLWIGYTVDMSRAGMKNVNLSLNVTNLTDKRYLGGGTPGSYFIGPARQVMASISVDF